MPPVLGSPSFGASVLRIVTCSSIGINSAVFTASFFSHLFLLLPLFLNIINPLIKHILIRIQFSFTLATWTGHDLQIILLLDIGFTATEYADDLPISPH